MLLPPVRHGHLSWAWETLASVLMVKGQAPPGESGASLLCVPGSVWWQQWFPERGEGDLPGTEGEMCLRQPGEREEDCRVCRGGAGWCHAFAVVPERGQRGGKGQQGTKERRGSEGPP